MGASKEQTLLHSDEVTENAAKADEVERVGGNTVQRATAQRRDRFMEVALGLAGCCCSYEQPHM